MGYFIFIGISYRINYQYLIVYIPLALLLAALTKSKLERVFLLVLALLPAAWIWLANMPWWFTNHTPAYPWVKDVFARVGLFERYLPDVYYVVFAGLLMVSGLAYVVLVFVRWQGNNLRSQKANLKSSS